MKRLLVVIVLAFSILAGYLLTKTQHEPVLAASSESYIGTVQLFAFNYAPQGWVRCEGQLLPLAQNTALFSLIGINYGGDGKSTFALPDLRGLSPVPGMEYYINLQGIYPSRN
ncbi:microcystin-dependent protein [Anaerobacillus alkaliphilus]|uniref:Microcystin-dependent protein n=2 Tax=Anaerobacillus alkaliphilus TaxID=1548597 RepID=A0A4Q0VUD6_9BACI|nr:microcystin-dependent protein [Anaerobacillus alkaliphilus]